MADEPTGNLDSASSVEIMNLFRRLNRESGITVIVVTHSTEIAAWSDRVITFKDGLIVSDKPTSEKAPEGACEATATLAQAPRGSGISLVVLISTAWKALRRNISRSLLTMLGIIIGVGAVIASMAIGSGAQAAVLKQIETLGANLVVITPGSISTGGVSLGSGTRTTLKLSDVSAIGDNVPEVAGVSPYSQISSQVIAGGLNWSTMIAGTNTSYPEVGNWALAQGRYFTDDEVAKVAKVAVLGSTVAANLFPTGNAVGSSITIKSVPFKVIGILGIEGTDGFRPGPGRHRDGADHHPSAAAVGANLGQQHPDLRLLPRRGRRRRGLDRAAPAAAAPPFPAPAGRFYDTQHRERPAGADRDDSDAVPPSRGGRRRLARGRRNRHHEHHAGVREREDARNRPAHGGRGEGPRYPAAIPHRGPLDGDRRGIIGVAIGIGVSDLTSLIGHWPTVITAFSVFLGLLSAAGTGVVFGYYPAQRAAALDPIEALRYE